MLFALRNVNKYDHKTLLPSVFFLHLLFDVLKLFTRGQSWMMLGMFWSLYVHSYREDFLDAPRRHCQRLLVVLLCVLFQSVISISKIRTMKWWTTRMEFRFTRESFIQLKLLSLPNVSEKFYVLKNARELRYELGKTEKLFSNIFEIEKELWFSIWFSRLRTLTLKAVVNIGIRD